MTAIEDAMSAILTARAAVYILGSPYEGDPTFDGVIDLLDRARALIEADPGYQRDRADRGRRTIARACPSCCAWTCWPSQGGR